MTRPDINKEIIEKYYRNLPSVVKVIQIKEAIEIDEGYRRRAYGNPSVQYIEYTKTSNWKTWLCLLVLTDVYSDEVMKAQHDYKA